MAFRGVDVVSGATGRATIGGVDRRVALAAAAVVGGAAAVMLIRVLSRSRDADDEEAFEHVGSGTQSPVKAAATPFPAKAAAPATPPRQEPAEATSVSAAPSSPEPASPPAAQPSAPTEPNSAAPSPNTFARMERSTAREDAIAMAMEASGAADMGIDDPDVIDLQREGYITALEMDATCALAWYKLGTFDCPAVLPFNMAAGASTDRADWTNDRRAKITTVAPLECTRRAIDLVVSSNGDADVDGNREQLQEGWVLADAYYNLGKDLMSRVQGGTPVDTQEGKRQKSTATIAGKELSWVDCLAQSVSLDPLDASKWMELAQGIDNDDDTDGHAAQQVAIGRLHFTARDMYHRVATGRLDPNAADVCARDVVDAFDRSMAWQCLGVSLAALSSGGKATYPVRHNDVPVLDIRSALTSEAVFTAIRRFKWPSNGAAGDATSDWTALECLQAALVTMPMSCMVWADLAKHLIEAFGGDGAARPEDPEALSPVDCIAAALDVDPTDADIWTLLASCLDAGFARDRAQAQVLSKPLSNWRPIDCLIQAVERDSSRAEPWYNLGLVAPNGASVHVPGASAPARYSQSELLAQAIERRPTWASAWARLGHILVLTGQQGSVLAGAQVAVAGQSVKALAAFTRSAELDPSLAMAWAGLALSLSDDASVTVRGVDYTRRACAAKRDAIGGVESPEPAGADDDFDDADQLLQPQPDTDLE